ncbi:DoxX family protein [Persicobacter psychrovividus]|uniref:DoxX family protein n=1 Tax=Persicobacter psychrovividus TaxID=387638 RepID=A0ABM7VE07_9BACT|nr:hypothetical protein PEPS_14620 [Persicobacter psychrovividus]
MSIKTLSKIFYGATALFTVMMLMSAGMYIFKTDMVAQMLSSLGYPTYIIYPLALAKVLGIVAIWINHSQSLKEWAYAGFFFDFTLAIFAHLEVSDGQAGGAVLAMVLLLASYFTEKKVRAPQAVAQQEKELSKA